MGRVFVALLVVLIVLPAVAAGLPDKFLPDKCTTSPPFMCVEYGARWGSNGSDGELYISFRKVGNGSDFSEIVVRDHDWSCILSTDNKSAWLPDDQRSFTAKNCSFATLETSKFKTTLYVDNKTFGTLYTIVEGSPYPRQTFWEKYAPWLILLLYLSLPLLFTLGAIWISIRFFRKHLFWISWVSCIFCVCFAALVFLSILLAWYQWTNHLVFLMWNYLVFLIWPPFIVLPATLALVGGIVSYRSRRKKRRWSLWIPIVVGGLFVLLCVLLLLYLLLGSFSDGGIR